MRVIVFLLLCVCNVAQASGVWTQLGGMLLADDVELERVLEQADELDLEQADELDLEQADELEADDQVK